jgi:hypothetical protein
VVGAEPIVIVMMPAGTIDAAAGRCRRTGKRNARGLRNHGRRGERGEIAVDDTAGMELVSEDERR